jgi:hypothetical protein
MEGEKKRGKEGKEKGRKKWKEGRERKRYLKSSW